MTHAGAERLSPVPNLLTSAQLMRQQSGMSAISSGSGDVQRDHGRRRHGMDVLSRQNSVMEEREEDVAGVNAAYSNPCELLVERMVQLGLRWVAIYFTSRMALH